MGKEFQEIERKFLVHTEEYKKLSHQNDRIIQGFLSRHPDRTVRVRIRGGKGYLTIKGKSENGGLSRFEWEKEIPLNEAEALIPLCEPGRIDKTRYLINYLGQILEVDEFHGKNEGLTLAEIELEAIDDTFEKPTWLGEEVTGDRRYYNSQLSLYPFTGWSAKK